LRVLFPSWRFFDRLGQVPRLEFRAGADPDALGPWQPALPPLPRSSWHVLYNPAGNYFLAEQSLVERLLLEIEAEPRGGGPREAEVTELISFRLVERLIRRRVTRPDEHYQFRVLLSDAGAAPRDSDLVLLSEVYAP
jgi:hypothetical protein